MQNKPMQHKMVLLVVGLAVFTDMLVYGMIVPILPGYAAKLGVSQSAIGLLFGSYALALLAATPIMGVWSDRCGRRTPMLWGLLGLAASTLVFAFAKSFFLLVLARILQGISAAVTWVVGLALLADYFPSPQDRGGAMGLALSGQAIGTLLGPSVGGFLYQWGGYQVPFFFATALVAVDAFLRFYFVKDIAKPKIEEKIAVRSIFSTKPLLVVSGITLLGAALPSVLEPTLPLYFQSKFGASPGMIGLLFAIPSLAYGLTAPLIGRISNTLGRSKTMIIGLFCGGLMLPMTAMWQSIIMEVFVLALLGISFGFLLAPALVEMAEIADHHGYTYGVVYSIYNTIYSIGMFIGPVLGSILADLFSLQTALIIIGTIPILYLFIPCIAEYTGSKSTSISKNEPE